jgi:hypothetical protein
MTLKKTRNAIEKYLLKHLPLDPRWKIQIKYVDEIEGNASITGVVYRMTEYFAASIEIRNDIEGLQLALVLRHELLHVVHSDIYMLRTNIEQVEPTEVYIVAQIRTLDERVVTTTEYLIDYGKGPLSKEALNILFSPGEI